MKAKQKQIRKQIRREKIKAENERRRRDQRIKQIVCEMMPPEAPDLGIDRRRIDLLANVLISYLKEILENPPQANARPGVTESKMIN